MAVAQDVSPWVEMFAARTRQEESDALAAILALANARDVISFSGGFPDPATFPGEELADLLRELLRSGDASLLQYGPTRGLPGLRDYLTGRLETLEGRRPADDELLVTSGGVEALELLGKTFLDPGDRTARRGPDVPRRDHGVPELPGGGDRRPDGRRRPDGGRRGGRAGAPAGPGGSSCCTPSRTTRIRPA